MVETLLNYYQDHFPGEYSVKMSGRLTAELYGKFSFSEDPVHFCRIIMYDDSTDVDVYFKVPDVYIGCSVLPGGKPKDSLYTKIHLYWKQVIRYHLDSDLQYHMFLQSIKNRV